MIERFAQAPGGTVGIYTNLMTRRCVLEIVAAAKRHRLDRDPGRTGERELLDRVSRQRRRRRRDRRRRADDRRAVAGACDASGRTSCSDVAGIAFRDETGAIVRTAERVKITDLDSLPLPDRDAIDHQQYLDAWKTHHGASSVNLITARGCPYRCNWCSHAVYGYTHRRRSPANVADEVQCDRRSATTRPALVRRRRVHDQPPVAGERTPRSSRRRGIHRPFETITRADRLQNGRRACGCCSSSAAIASGSARRAAASGSSTRCSAACSVEQVRASVELAQAHGIQVGMFLMWGYEGEEIEDIAATVEHVKRQQSRRLLHDRRPTRSRAPATSRRYATRSRCRSTWERRIRSRLRGCRAPRQGLLQARRSVAAQRGRGGTHRNGATRCTRPSSWTRPEPRAKRDARAGARRERHGHGVAAVQDDLAATLRKTTEHLARELVQADRVAPPDWTELEWAIARSVAAMQGISMLARRTTCDGAGRRFGSLFLAEQREQCLLRDARSARCCSASTRRRARPRSVALG